MSVKVITQPVSHDELVALVSGREFEGLLVAGVHEPDPLTWVCNLRNAYPGRTLPIAILHSPTELAPAALALAARRFRDMESSRYPGTPRLKRSILIDQPSRQVVVDGAQTSLSPEEFRLLLFLMRYSDVVFSREELLYRTRPPESAVNPRMIDVLIGRLRSCIDESGTALSHITTVYGIGYRFVRQDEVFIDGFTGRSFESWPCCPDSTVRPDSHAQFFNNRFTSA